jgi:hypothetical protein
MKITMNKLCKDCNTYLPITDFTFDKRSRDKHNYLCRYCAQTRKKKGLQRRKNRTDTELLNIIRSMYSSGYKECSRCNSSVPVETGWNISRDREDGLTIYCKYCLENIRNNWDGRKELWKRREVEKKKDPDKVRRKKAALALCYAVRIGELVRPTICSLCKKEHKKIQGHHYAYEKPLETFIWVCPPCHSEIHFGKYPHLLPEELQVRLYSKVRGSVTE